jgi:hypothetical protein
MVISNDFTLLQGEILVQLCELQSWASKLPKDARRRLDEGISDLQKVLIFGDDNTPQFMVNILTRLWRS